MILKFPTALLAGLLFFITAHSQTNNNLQHKILGNWRFESGKYIYFDDADQKLKESEMTELREMTVVVTSRIARIIYPDKEEYSGSYSLYQDKGKQYVSLRLQGEAINYQITAISDHTITVKARHNIQFYVDGNENKKASYSIVVINFTRR